jgi:uncharacterized protein
MTVWWATEVECASAIARFERDEEITRGASQRAFDRLDDLVRAWTEVEPAPVVRRSARRLLRAHELRAADALQLAAALEAAEGDAPSLELVTLDKRLADAARREGFSVVDLS